MLTLHYQNIGLLTAFIRAAEKSKASWPEGAISELKRLVEEEGAGLQVAVDTLAAAWLEFQNKATKLGDQIADVIDDLEEGLKRDKDYMVPPSLANGLLGIRALIRGPGPGSMMMMDSDPPSGSTCWPNCSGSDSSYGALDRPPEKFAV